jgi:hypothetical protein
MTGAAAAGTETAGAEASATANAATKPDDDAFRRSTMIAFLKRNDYVATGVPMPNTL